MNRAYIAAPAAAVLAGAACAAPAPEAEISRPKEPNASDAITPASDAITEPAHTTTTEPAPSLVTVTTPPEAPDVPPFEVWPDQSAAESPAGDVAWLVEQTFPEEPARALRIARCESGLDPTAVSPDGANWGLLQINVVHRARAARMGYAWAQMLDAGPNLAVARAIYDEQGFEPWACAA